MPGTGLGVWRRRSGGGDKSSANLVFQFSSLSGTFQDTAGTTPAGVHIDPVKRWNSVGDPTIFAQWQSGAVPQYLAASRAGGPSVYADTGGLQVFGLPTVWDPTIDWTYAITYLSRYDVGGTIKPLFGKAAADSDPWLVSDYDHHSRLAALTTDNSPGTFDYRDLNYNVRVAVFKWSAASQTLKIFNNTRLAATLTGALPALDAVNNYILFGSLPGGVGNSDSNSSIFDLHYWTGHTTDAEDIAHVKLMQRTHFQNQIYCMFWGDSLTQYTTSGWVKSLIDTLGTAGYYPPTVNVAFGGQTMTFFAPVGADNNMDANYAAREGKLAGDPTLNNVAVGLEWVNQAFQRWFALGQPADGSFDATPIITDGMTQLQIQVARLRASGYQTVVVMNMYDCNPTAYVTPTIKHGINAAMAVAFPNAHPRVAHVALPSGSGPDLGDYMIDAAALPNIGPDGSCTNITYFMADQVHPQLAAAPLIAAPVVALFQDWLLPGNDPFPARAKLALQDTTTGLFAKYTLEGNTSDVSGNGRDLSIVGSGSSFQAGINGQEFVTAGTSALNRADETALRFLRNGQTYFQFCMEIKPSSFGGVPFYAVKDAEWDVLDVTSNGGLRFRIFDSGGGVICQLDLPVFSVPTTKHSYLSFGADLVNKNAFVCLNGALSVRKYTGTPQTGLTSPLRLFSYLGSNFLPTTSGEVRIYTQIPMTTRDRELAIATQMGLGWL